MHIGVFFNSLADISSISFSTLAVSGKYLNKRLVMHPDSGMIY